MRVVGIKNPLTPFLSLSQFFSFPSRKNRRALLFPSPPPWSFCSSLFSPRVRILWWKFETLYHGFAGNGGPSLLLTSERSILFHFPISGGFRLFFLCLFSCRLLAQGRRKPFGGLLLRKAVAGWALEQSPLGTSSKGAGARLALASIRGHRLAVWRAG